jgi:hypothetical protein
VEFYELILQPMDHASIIRRHRKAQAEAFQEREYNRAHKKPLKWLEFDDYKHSPYLFYCAFVDLSDANTTTQKEP